MRGPFPLRGYFSSGTGHGRGSGTDCSASPGIAFGNIVAAGWATLLGKVSFPEPLVVCALAPPSELLKGWWGWWKSEWWEE